MDSLARSLGLNIEQLAIQLALDSDQPHKPTEIRAVEQSYSEFARKANIKYPTSEKKQGAFTGFIRPTNSLKNSKASPIINPIVLRPVQQTGGATKHDLSSILENSGSELSDN